MAWHSFELDPRPADRRPEGDQYDYLAPVHTAAAGLEFRPDLVVPRKTADAHRMVHLAAQHGRAAETVVRLERGYWAQGRDLAMGTLFQGMVDFNGGLPVCWA